MSARRRETDRDSSASAQGIWQRYADEIGIPTSAQPAAAGESLRRQTEEARPRRQPTRTRRSVGRILTAATAIVVTVAAGLALWPSSPTSPDRTELRASTVASAPSRDVSRIPDERATVPTRLVEMPSRITFDFASDQITDESKASLGKVVLAMISNPDWRLVLEGHTDAHGAVDQNRSLSERRAEAARAFLETSGISPERLRTMGFGAVRPVAPHSPEGNVLNRRVDIQRE